MASSFLSPAAGADSADTGAEVDVEHTDVSAGGDSGGAAADTGGDSTAADTSQQTQETTDQPAGKADPTEFKRHLSEVSKVNKPLADRLKADRYKVAKFEEAGFKTPEEAVALRESIDNIVDSVSGTSGLEAIEHFQADAQEFAQEIAQFTKGDPALLDKLAETSPDGLAKLVPYGASLLKKLNPEGYQSLTHSLANEELAANFVYEHVQTLLETITNGGDGAQKAAADLTKRLQAYLEKFKQAGAKSGGLDKEREEFQKEKQTYEQQKAEKEENEFAERVLGTVNPEVTRQVREHLQSFVPKGYKLPEATENKIIEEVFKGINAELLKKSDYQSRYEALLKTKDHKRVSQFIRTRVDPVLRDLTKSTYDVFRGANPTVRRAAPPANGNANRQPVPDRGAKNYKPTLQEALRVGVTKEEWLMGTQSKKIVKNGRTLYQWN